MVGAVEGHGGTWVDFDDRALGRANRVDVGESSVGIPGVGGRAPGR